MFVELFFFFFMRRWRICLFFFFQAEDGIRDVAVTGVQTCALPICPDADVDSVGRGPRGYDEINQARGPGNYGWPYFVGNNQAYYKTTVIDSVTTQGGPQFDPAHPVNTSPNNAGLNALPPARGAYIWYPYAPSPDFPIVGTGGRTAEAGPVFYRDDFRNAARPFPRTTT